jgi:O-acetyl-ADP-ribose deacetylase (regulator of RNase III)
MIHYLVGDATQPQGEGPKLIVHICNSFGGWGRGFVLALSRRWRAPEFAYRAWSRDGVWVDEVTRKVYDKHKGEYTGETRTYDFQTKFGLGRVQYIQVEKDIEVANMIAQNDRVQYFAVERGLKRIARWATRRGQTLHMPRIGCGLGGGTWDRIEPLISEQCKGLEVFVYDLPTR